MHWMISSILVYGFDMSEMNSLDTGGFDMDVGEGTGQPPEDWEKRLWRNRKNDGNENREDENLMEDSSVWGRNRKWTGGFSAMEFGLPGRRSTFSGRELCGKRKYCERKFRWR